MVQFCLGTAQFGQNYGVTNTLGRPPFNEVVDMLDYAWTNGVTLLDTAYLYGDSEQVLGDVLAQSSYNFLIVTKTPKFALTDGSQNKASQLEAKFYESLQRLQKDQLYALLIHDDIDLLQPGAGYLVDKLWQLKNQGLIKKIGFSIFNRYHYDSEQVIAIAKKFGFELIQLPVNVFDQKLVNSGCLKSLKKLGLEVHVRSIFLQGVLLSAPENLPASVAEFEQPLRIYHDEMMHRGLTPLQAAMKFACQINDADAIVCGSATTSQLAECLEAFQFSQFVNESYDFSKFSLNTSIVDPCTWSKCN